MQDQINRLSKEVSTLSATQKINHDQNRKDIHDIRSGQQAVRDALYNGFEKLSNAFETSLAPIRKDIFDLQMWKSKTTGYVLGISAASAAVFALVEKLVSAGLK